MTASSAVLGRALHHKYSTSRCLLTPSCRAPGRWIHGLTRDWQAAFGNQQHCPCPLAPSALPYRFHDVSSPQQAYSTYDGHVYSPGDFASSRCDSLSQLQAFLGYQFNSPALLQQACTHSSDKAELSYRQLAFLGDAVLWLLFAEHAFNKFGPFEDPISGAWPTHMSAILSRSNCAATARQWGLQHYLQHTRQQQQQQQQQQCTSSSSSSGIRSGMYQGNWNSDSLAEMFEGVIGALLLDSCYVTVRQLLQPWVEQSFAAARAAAAAAASSQPMHQDTAAGSSSSSSTVQEIPAADLYGYQTLMQQQVHALCGYAFNDGELLHTCCQHISLLLAHGSSSAEQEKWHFLGYSILRFAAAQHVYCCQQQQYDRTVIEAHDIMHCSSSSSSNATTSSSSSSRSSSQNATWLLDQPELTECISSDDDSTSSSGSSGSSGGSSSSRNVVHLMSKQMVHLTTVRHRCKMWLHLGLDPYPYFPANSHIFTVKWKIQKNLISRCLDLLLAAVYLDQGLAAALGVAGYLLSDTPRTGIDKSWIPGWAIKGAAAAAYTAQCGVVTQRSPR